MTNGKIVWFEIPVNHLERSIQFYSKVLSVKIEKNKFLDEEHGVFNIQDSVRGVLVERKDHNFCPGIVLFFYVIDISESIREVERNGGQIIRGKTLIKQRNQFGQVTINDNLIDGNLGYYAEILDCDGNRISLYSNS
jgi:predicted enzyme related to lactoylglutathione lyase